MTKTELAAKALRELNVWERGQPVNGEYVETVTTEYDELYEELTLLNRQFWAQDDIPKPAARHLAVLLADRLSGEFGKSDQFMNRLSFQADGANNHQSAMSRLKEMTESQDDPRSNAEPEDF